MILASLSKYERKYFRMDTALFPVLTDQDAQLPLYLTSVGHWDHQETVRRPDGFPYYQWLQIVSGEGEAAIGHRRITVKAGQALILFPHIPHQYEPSKGPWQLYWASFDGGLAAELLGQAGIVRSGVYPAARRDLPVQHLRNLLDMARSGHSFAGVEYSKSLYGFLLDLPKFVQERSPISEQYRSRLQPALRHVEQHLHHTISISEMAETIGTSPQHLCTLFRKTLAMRPMEYVNRERIKRSKELMFRQSGLAIREVAREVGLDNPSYFSSLFKKLEGLSPEQFKRLHGLKM
jgi:AraC family transcriptional regulator of arabinose operon